MSIQAVAWALEREVRVRRQADSKAGACDPLAKLILISLANRADHVTGLCWPGMKLIAKEAGCARETVLRKLPVLEELGLIEIIRAKTGARKRAHSYRLLLHPCDERSHQTGGRDVTRDHKACDPEITTRTITEPLPLTPTPLPPRSAKRIGDRSRGECSIYPGTPAFDAWLAFAETINGAKLVKVLNEARAAGSPARMSAPLPPRLPMQRPARAPP